MTWAMQSIRCWRASRRYAYPVKLLIQIRGRCQDSREISFVVHREPSPSATAGLGGGVGCSTFSSGPSCRPQAEGAAGCRLLIVEPETVLIRSAIATPAPPPPSFQQERRGSRGE